MMVLRGVLQSPRSTLGFETNYPVKMLAEVAPGPVEYSGNIMPVLASLKAMLYGTNG